MTAPIRVPTQYLREKVDTLDSYLHIIETIGQARRGTLEEIRFLGESIAKEAERWLGEEVEG